MSSIVTDDSLIVEPLLRHSDYLRRRLRYGLFTVTPRSWRHSQRNAVNQHESMLYVTCGTATTATTSRLLGASPHY